jgi:hypothetical protein
MPNYKAQVSNRTFGQATAFFVVVESSISLQLYDFSVESN